MYKILSVHIIVNDHACIVSVAIQSDVNEDKATHFKAYQTERHIMVGNMAAVFQNVAARGNKLSKEKACTIFPELSHLNYY
jgi:hypothetical protein